jgi:hypothetical protein
VRYEHIELDISTVACAELQTMLERYRKAPWGYSENAIANAELHNLHNELLARLQRRDADPHCPKNAPSPYSGKFHENARIEQVHRDIADQTGWVDGGIEL